MTAYQSKDGQYVYGQCVEPETAIINGVKSKTCYGKLQKHDFVIKWVRDEDSNWALDWVVVAGVTGNPSWVGQDISSLLNQQISCLRPIIYIVPNKLQVEALPLP